MTFKDTIVHVTIIQTIYVEPCDNFKNLGPSIGSSMSNSLMRALSSLLFLPRTFDKRTLLL